MALETGDVARAQASPLHGIVGQSPAVQRVLALVAQVAASRATVLLTGESGTGKELVARAIHAISPRATKPFISVSCAALPEGLIESELFGHEKGAFTGAQSLKKGRFELAHEATLFLDEVGELPVATQVKLLRVLQERVFERVGGVVPINVDVRLVAATNRKLLAAIEEGRFREDLYYRLHVIEIPLPPLRERGEDLQALVTHFVDRYARENGKAIKRVAPQALSALEAYGWPGNVRELENVIQRAVVLTTGDEIDLDVIPDSVRVARSNPASSTPTRPSAHPVENIVTRLPGFADLTQQAQGVAVCLAVHLAEEISVKLAISQLLFMPERGKRGGGGGLGAHETWPAFRALAYALAGVVLWDLRANQAIEDPTARDLERYTTGFTRGKPTPLLEQVRSLVVTPRVSAAASRTVDITR